MSRTAVLILLVLAQVWSAQAKAQSDSSKTLERWLGTHFRSVMAQCVPRADNKKYELNDEEKIGEFIPSRLSDEAFFKSSLELPYQDLGGFSMSRVFGAVLPNSAKFESLKISGSRFLPDDYNMVETPLVAKGVEAWRVRTDCSLAVNAASKVKLKKKLLATEIIAAIEADAENTSKNQFEIVYGVFESPFYRNFGSASADRSATSLVHYGLMLWDYHSSKSGNDSDEWLVASFRGLASYRAAQSGGTFKTAADFRIGPDGQPVMKAAGDAGSTSSLELTSFGAIALLDGSERLMPLPTARSIVEKVADQQVFMLVDNVNDPAESVVTYMPRVGFEYSAAKAGYRERVQQFSTAIPERMCVEKWQGTDDNVAKIVWAGYLKGNGPGGQSGCLLIVDYTTSKTKPISARVKLKNEVDGQSFELPLQTVSFRQITAPKLSYNPSKSSKISGAVSTNGEGLGAQTTWTWIYVFDITQSTNPFDSVRSIGADPTATVDASCVDADPFNKVSAQLMIGASSNNSLAVTLNRTISASSSDKINTKPVGCLLSIKATAFLGPDNAAVDFEVPKQEQILIPVLDSDPTAIDVAATG